MITLRSSLNRVRRAVCFSLLIALASSFVYFSYPPLYEALDGLNLEGVTVDGGVELDRAAFFIASFLEMYAGLSIVGGYYHLIHAAYGGGIGSRFVKLLFGRWLIEALLGAFFCTVAMRFVERKWG
jgi:hypothetical protein